ncbi:hypothetical protein HanXRQr2_Chr06g0252551 [Helianthus annuus]|uniref:Uncharacterized protein n=1 Tax=Helianthus annuus TaxID=4232 RepID=A0A9K3ISA8_HELAN|nr:hypothetical protein HanXRQr2_Chr06g0252551 [Helianthus annuus]KAJ0560059.1 hypothetical protein HanHA300_Chr06g0207271 [Helianthus annuus]KAJ0573054.1 hypothetical protein HanHA89_Chr06g0222551 [Helianthus annuus]KAJ0740356.1 hypothetical protein HanOQP8_Chr06g0215911 [Helianthus annuus]
MVVVSGGRVSDRWFESQTGGSCQGPTVFVFDRRVSSINFPPLLISFTFFFVSEVDVVVQLGLSSGSRLAGSGLSQQEIGNVFGVSD